MREWPLAVKAATEGQANISRPRVANVDQRTGVAIRTRRWHAKILRACLVDGFAEQARVLVSAAPHEALKSLPRAADFHRVIGAVHETVRGSLPDEVAAEIDRLYREERARHLIVMGNLARVRQIMNEIRISFLVVKGPVLAQLVYRRRIRFYRDLDLIVPRASFASALRALEECGAEVIDPNWGYLNDQVAGELELTTGVDLHWHFLFSETLRRDMNIRMDDVFHRARELSLGGGPVVTLDPVDTLIHLALHATKEGGRRLIWLKDLEQSVLNDRPTWSDVVARSREWRVEIFVGTILLRTSRVLGLAIPTEVLRELIPSRSWRAVLATADRLFPVDVWTGSETPATLVAESARRDVPATIAQIGSRVVARGRASLSGGSAAAVTSPQPASARREAFLDRVTGGR